MRRLHLANCRLRCSCKCKECRLRLKVEVCINASVLLHVGLAFRQSRLWLEDRIVLTLSVVTLSSGTRIRCLLIFLIYIVSFPTISLLSISFSPLGLDEVFIYNDWLGAVTWLLAHEGFSLHLHVLAQSSRGRR